MEQFREIQRFQELYGFVRIETNCLNDKQWKIDSST